MVDPREILVEGPWVAPDAFVARNATVIGEVHLAAEASVWFGAVIRGDVAPIAVGRGSNIQDLSVLHADDGFPCTIGAGVTVGHRCIVHGCTVGDGSLVGMGAILLNGCVVGEESLVGAGALVTQNVRIPPRSLVLGSPGRVVRALRDDELAELRRSAAHYVAMGRRYRERGHGRIVGEP